MPPFMSHDDGTPMGYVYVVMENGLPAAVGQRYDQVTAFIMSAGEKRAKHMDIVDARWL